MPVELPFDPNLVPQLLKEGRMKIVGATQTPSHPENPKTEIHGSVVERAKAIFGEDFLGEEAIHLMEDKLKTAGIDVRFEIPDPNTFPYSQQDIEQAKQDDAKDRARMLVLRPSWMVVKEKGQDVRKPINILNLRELFKKEARNKLGMVTGVTYDRNPFGSGAVFYKQDWYDEQDFAKAQLDSGYSLPTKEVLPNSTSMTWHNQQNLLEPGERRRGAVEVVWDEILYYARTGKKVLPNRWDWTKTQTSDGRLVHVGAFASDGLRVARWDPDETHSNLGVVPSR